ncbi:hypothetical protein ACFYVL_42715 [Streptomyces sp. NPDC004111]|uniref:hypothetical protein n=1 Tax=Streptomyces sp. NPDC004111 TaxID=3364690 RepID=UPI0036BFF291
MVLRGSREQVHPAVLLVLLLPCLWWATVPLLVGYQLARTTRRVFPTLPEGHLGDPTLLRVQRVRTWVAIAASGLLLVVFGDWSDAWRAQGQLLQRAVFAPWLALICAVVAVALLFGIARPGTRRPMGAHLWPAGRSALCYFAAWALVQLLFIAGGKGMGLLSHTGDGPLGLLLRGAGLLVCWAPFWWMCCFLCFATGPALRHAFNLSAAHALLPALVTTVLACVFAVRVLSSGGLPPGPVPVAICAFLAGPVSVTALAWWEIHRLRQQHGVRWRGHRT